MTNYIHTLHNVTTQIYILPSKTAENTEFCLHIILNISEDLLTKLKICSQNDFLFEEVLQIGMSDESTQAGLTALIICVKTCWKLHVPHYDVVPHLHLLI